MFKGSVEDVLAEEFAGDFGEEVLEVAHQGNVNRVKFLVVIQFLGQFDFVIEVKHRTDNKGANKHKDRKP